MATDPTQIFREEAAELLVQLEETLLSLEESPDDRDLLDTAFRALHTIKGSGAMFGFDAVAAFTHHLENAFDRVRKGKLAASAALIAVSLAAKDHIRALIEQPAATDPAAGEQLLAELAGMIDEDGTPAAETLPVVAAEAEPGEAAPVTYRIHFALPPETLDRGLNPLLLLDELRELGSCTVVALTETVPDLAAFEATWLYLSWDVVLTTAQPRSAIDDVFVFVIDDMELSVEPIAVEGDRLGDILVDRGAVTPEVVEAAVASQRRIGALLVEGGQVSADGLRSALGEQKHLRKEAEEARPAAQASSSIRVPAERLDGLMDQVGELVIAQARLKQALATRDLLQVTPIAEEIERLTSSLRDTTMGIRMVPISTLFGRFRRLVHDLSKELGKEITLTTAGEDTELDKTMIERLNDPLVHLIRNSIDHGIEGGAERLKVGKPAQGHIHLSAIYSGAQVLIRVEDDGRGLDAARIRAKAEEVGLVAPGVELPESELFELIMHPGFSTASKVTSVSGRGVGMDVVKRAIESLRGTIEITSQRGTGSAMTLRLPLTLAIIDGLLVRVGHGRYVIPLSAVEECVELTEEDAHASGSHFLNIRGALVPFLGLRELFDVRTPLEPYQKVVIVATGEQRIGLVVDQLIGEHQTVIKSLSKLHAGIQTFSGATILGDGTVALILDTPHLVELGQEREQRRQAS